jgi:predicted transposase YdaD
MPARRTQPPAQRFDKTIKKLFQTLPSRLIEWLTGQPPVELLTVEFPTVESRSADLVFRLPNGEIHQIELQSDNDETMDVRMLERKFGALPPWAIRRLAAAKTEMLIE